MSGGIAVFRLLGPMGGSLGGSLVKRRAVAFLCRILGVAVVLWMAWLAHAWEGLARYDALLGMLAEFFIVSILFALVCPEVALRRGRVNSPSSAAKLLGIGFILALLLPLVFPERLDPQQALASGRILYYLSTFTVAGILYIGATRILAYLSKFSVPRKILLIGDEERSKAVQRRISRHLGVGTPTQIAVRPLPEVTPDELIRLAADEGADEVVIAAPDGGGRGILGLRLPDLRLKVQTAARFLESATGRVEINRLSQDCVVHLDNPTEASPAEVIKRCADIAGSFVALVMSAPLMLLIAIAVKLCDAGPVIYRQIRVGYSGKPFVLYKFRTMSVDAEEPGKPVWAKKGDRRVTSVGRLLRLTRADELPQLVNVLKGQMSLVGPRPERPEIVLCLQHEIIGYSLRHSMKPGITGWAQLKVGYTSDVAGARRKLAYDLYYIRHFSILLDVYILAKTLNTVLWMEGAR